MFDWLRQLFLKAIARSNQHAALLEELEQQACIAREQLNEALLLAHSSTNPETKVARLELAKSKLAQLQAIAARHPRMRVTNEEEVKTAIQLLEKAFSRAGYYAIANASRKQHASVHVSISTRSQELLHSSRHDVNSKG